MSAWTVITSTGSLGECLNQYYTHDTNNPVRKNLEFFIPLRNKIEHRSLPEIDPSIFGECQAMLLNFDEMLEREFGRKYCIRQSLSFALQIYPSAENLIEAVKRNRAAKTAAEFVEQYRSSLSPEIYGNGKYVFKAQPTLFHCPNSSFFLRKLGLFLRIFLIESFETTIKESSHGRFLRTPEKEEVNQGLRC
jgi:hypothetical protein